MEETERADAREGERRPFFLDPNTKWLAVNLLKLAPLPRRGDVEDLAVLGHRAAGQFDALFL